MSRFREDIAWRFGQATIEPVNAIPRRVARRQKAYEADGARSGQQRASEEVERTVRTAS